MKNEYDFRGAKRGALDPVSPGKTRITIRSRALSKALAVLQEMFEE